MAQSGRTGAAATYVNLGIVVTVAIGLVFVLIGISGPFVPNPTLFLGFGIVFWLVALGGFMLSSEKIRQRDFYGARAPTMAFGLLLIVLGAIAAALLINLSSFFLLLSFGAIIAGLLFVIAHLAIQPYAPAPSPPVVSEGRPPSGTTVIATPPSTRLSGIASLACQTGPNTGRVFPVGSGVTRLGRGSHNEVDLGEGDDKISRSHAEISYNGRDFYVQDIGSMNGTWVDGTIVPKGSKSKMRDGAELRLGPVTTLVFRSERDTRLASD